MLHIFWDHVMHLISPAEAGNKKTALAAAVIQQGKAFRVRHLATTH